MKKKLLVLAVGATITVVPMLIAQADVKIYGNAQVELAQRKNKLVTVGDDTAQFANDNGRGTWGIEATEDMGGGLTGLAKFEFQVDTAGGADKADSQKDREMYVGLRGGFGTLRLGRVNSPYKLTGVALDPFVATNLEARSNGGMSSGCAAGTLSGCATAYGNPGGAVLYGQGSGYVSNGIVYNMPKMAGVGFDVYYSNDEQDNTNAWLSAAVTWAGGPVSVFVVHNKQNQTSFTAGLFKDSVADKVGGQVKLGGGGMSHTISGQYEEIDKDTGLPGAEVKVTFLGYQLGIGNTIGVAQLGRTKQDTAPFGTVTKYLAVGGIYNFTKTFRAFGGLRTTKTEAATTTLDERILSAGLRKDF